MSGLFPVEPPARERGQAWESLAALIAGRPMGGYGVILADPPWAYELYSAKGEAKAPQAHYACEGVDAIAAMPVAALAAADAALFLWATFPMLPHALAVMAAWGFRYSSGAAWAKQSSGGGKWAFGTGYVFRSAAELLLVGVRGAPRVQDHGQRNLIVAPVREHSRKPDQAHAIAEALFAGPYVELFARQRRPGWDAWGNETGKFPAQDEAQVTAQDAASIDAANIGGGA